MKSFTSAISNMVKNFSKKESNSSRNIAKERLSIILAHQRGVSALEGVNVPLLQRELMDCIQKHISIVQNGDVQLSVKQEGELDVFEMQVPLEHHKQ